MSKEEDLKGIKFFPFDFSFNQTQMQLSLIITGLISTVVLVVVALPGTGGDVGVDATAVNILEAPHLIARLTRRTTELDNEDDEDTTESEEEEEEDTHEEEEDEDDEQDGRSFLSPSQIIHRLLFSEAEDNSDSTEDNDMHVPNTCAGYSRDYETFQSRVIETGTVSTAPPTPHSDNLLLFSSLNSLGLTEQEEEGEEEVEETLVSQASDQLKNSNNNDRLLQTPPGSPSMVPRRRILPQDRISVSYPNRNLHEDDEEDQSPMINHQAVRNFHRHHRMSWPPTPPTTPPRTRRTATTRSLGALDDITDTATILFVDNESAGRIRSGDDDDDDAQQDNVDSDVEFWKLG